LKTRFLYIVLVAFIGLLSLPGESRACGAKATGIQKAKCAKAKKAHGNHLLAKKSCDSKDSHDPCGKDCGGKCGHGNCKCIATCLNTAIIAPAEFRSETQFAGLSDQKSLYQPAHISSGFYFIWLPPKIS
jgi:hypothetical protein